MFPPRIVCRKGRASTRRSPAVPPRARSFRDVIREVGDAGGLDRADALEADLRASEVVEQPRAISGEDRNEVERNFVDQPFLQVVLLVGGIGETAAEPPGRAACPEAASSVAPIASAIGVLCVLASERPSHPGDETRSANPSWATFAPPPRATSFPATKPSRDVEMSNLSFPTESHSGGIRTWLVLLRERR
jgi:hypothetical protein